MAHPAFDAAPRRHVIALATALAVALVALGIYLIGLAHGARLERGPRLSLPRSTPRPGARRVWLDPERARPRLDTLPPSPPREPPPFDGKGGTWPGTAPPPDEP